MEVRLLGSLEVDVAGGAPAPTAAKPRAVLAMLALRANETVSADQLIEGLWDERAPQSAHKLVQQHVSELRKLLRHDDAGIVTRGRGYELRVPPETVDALRFERLVAAAERAEERSYGSARAALALWRGPPLDDLADEPFAAAEVRRLEELWLRAIELANDERLAAGEHAEVAGELGRLVELHPLRERLHGQRMLALYRCGRQAEALEAFRDAHEWLVGEAGVEPGPDLRALQEAMLRHDPALELQPIRAHAGTGAADSEAGPAERIQSAALAIEGERKQVTILCASLDDLGTDRDPEEWRDGLSGLVALVGEVAHEYGGTLTAPAGDGVTALFGAPLAHEDHARRACLSALRLRESLVDSAEIVARIGLNSGEVVVGAIGDDLRLDYTAVGRSVSEARRMERLGNAGRPVISAPTAALVDGLFELEELQAGEAFALVGEGVARSRFDAAAARGLSPLVGRERELIMLEAALDRAREGGRVVGVAAEPGVGKSRLCREFVDRCRARAIPAAVGAGVPHGRGVPLLPVLTMLRDRFGITMSDDPVDARARVRAVLSGSDVEDLLPVLFDFLGLPDPGQPVPSMAPEGRERALLAILRELVHAGNEPGVLLIEDLHWLDPGSEAFLDHLVDSVPGGRVLLVVNFRPEFRAAWTSRSYYERITLLPLDSGSVARLLQGLLGSDPSLDGLAGLLDERTGGNPLFIEEVLRGLRQGGALVETPAGYRLEQRLAEIEVPPSVQALLAARVDRLPEREKDLLWQAAVIGRDFSEPVLRHVSGLDEPSLTAALHELADAELIGQRELHPVLRYEFRHPLAQEVAYRSQLRERRARTHAAAAEAIEELYPDRLDELAGLISRHWEEAGEPLGAARWGARAATWAAPAHPADALRQWTRVRALIRDRMDAPDAPGLALLACVWTLHAGARFGLSAEEFDATYAEALEFAEASGETSMRAVVRSADSIRTLMGGPLDEGIEARREAQALAEEAGNLELRVSLGPGLWLGFAGRNREALAELDRVIELGGDDFELGRRVLGLSAVLLARLWRAIALLELGRGKEGRAAVAETERLVRLADDFELRIWVGCAPGALAWFSGEPGDAVARVREMVALGDRQGSGMTRAVARWQLAAAQLTAGEHADALATAKEGLAIMRTRRTWLHFEGLMLALAAQAKLGLGDARGARETAQQAVAAAESRRARIHEAIARQVLARAMLAERPADARVELDRAADLAGEDGAGWIPHIEETRAELAAAEGDGKTARRHLEKALGLFAEQGAKGHARRVAGALG